MGLSVFGANMASQPGLAALDDTAAGFNVGGGLFIWLGKHLGLRGDARYFRTFAEVGADRPLGLEKLDFWRGIGGLTLRFWAAGPPTTIRLLQPRQSGPRRNQGTRGERPRKAPATPARAGSSPAPRTNRYSWMPLRSR